MILRDYQQDLYDRTMACVDGGGNPIVCAPCGAGKTAIMEHIVGTAEQRGMKPLVIAHRTELLSQIMRDLSGVIHDDRFQSVFTLARHLDRVDTGLLVIDEAHLSQAQSYLRVAEAAGCRVVGLTATPTRLDGQPLSLYTEIVQGVSADDLIDRGYLAPYDLYAPTIYDVSGIKPSGSDYTAEDLAGVVLQSKLYGDIVDHYRRLADGQQAIAYCSTVEHSQSVSKAFCDAGIPAVHIDGKSPHRERQEALDALRDGRIKVLCNVNLISEGISIPECSVVLGLRPTQSRALYIQQMCRALRYKPGKRATLIDFSGNVHRHGWPTEDYKYELGVPARARKEMDDEGNLIVRICENCFRTYDSSKKICPFCGAEYITTPREIKVKQDIILAKIKQEEVQKEQERIKQMREETREAKTIGDLRAIARKNGYSQKWVYVQAKIRGIYKGAN